MFKLFLQELETSSKKRYFWIFTLLYAMMMAMPSYFYSKIDRDSDDILPFLAAYIFSKIISEVCTKFYKPFLNGLNMELREKLIEKNFKKYYSLTFQSKNQVSIFDFKSKMVAASYSIVSFVDWGIPTFIALVTSMMSTIWIFYKYSLTRMLIFIIIGNIAMYYLIIKKKQTEFSKFKKKSRINRQYLCEELESKLPWIETGKGNINDIIEMENRMHLFSKNDNDKWHRISAITSISNILPLMMFLLCDASDATRILIMMSTFQKFSSALKNALNYMNVYNQHLQKVELFQDIWKGLEFKTTTIDIDIPKTISITDTNIKRGNFTVKFAIKNDVLHNTAKLIIKQSDKILIKGRSGHGKSTFINGLLGKIPGVILKENKPENYYWQIGEFYQDIKERIPTNKITIRKLFDDNADDALINEFLDLVKLTSWLNSLKQSTDGKYDINVLDRYISNLHSGGEKTRLALAVRLYFAYISGAKMLLLDEPDQGVEPVDAYEVYQNIFKKFNALTIIVVSHLERIENTFIWDTRLRLDYGVISIKQ